ncbi:MAG TPA: hypothetical protein VM285_09000 [Polyangia bacterium]|nr:hypothetical protein [Polyangia bacterium]
MVDPGDPLEAGLSIARAFEAHGVPYALGGALAYGLWGVPRATVDVDVNVFVREDGIPDVFRALRSLGIALEEEAATGAIERDGMFAARFGLFRVDVFTPSIEFAWEAERTRVRRSIEGQDVDFLSAEALAVFKLLFFRAKDIVDLQRLIAVQGARLDVGYVRSRIASMMGEDDERVRRWDELVEKHMPGLA